MYKFHYDFMKENTDVIFNLLVTDTDSFIYEIIGEDFYEIMYQNKEFFDLSDFPKGSKYFCNDNKKVIDKTKYGRKIIYEITALKSKMYSIRNVNNDEKSIHKGHNSSIKNEKYKNIHFNKKAIRHKMRGIKSKKHELFTYESNKRSLCDFDDKRYILDDGINTLPYGHKDIPINE